jgi:ribosomal protein S18 acetylase RimI-like enzyme
VAEHDKLIVGYGAQEYSFYDNGFVSMLYIHATYRRQGFGTQIMRYFESICQTEKLFTSTNQSNKPMQSLLEYMGYKPSGTIENLDVGDPELVYLKRLNIKHTR